MSAKRGVILAVGVAVLVALGVGSGVAFASIPDASGVIHGCYQPQSDGHNTALSVIDTAKPHGSCPGGQTELNWNQTGPQGPAGATGATGPQGPAGPSTAGPSGLNVTVVSSATGEAVCPSAEPYVIGGGGANGGGNTVNLTNVQSQPLADPSGPGAGAWDNAWVFSVSPFGSGQTFTAYAMCAK